MNKKFLEDYEAKEREELEKFFKNLQEGKNGENERYSPLNRLKLGKTYTMLVPVGDLWCQMPLCDTTIIALRPIKDKQEFERVHGFHIGDIDSLIDLAKRENVVQFALGRSPITYENMDFLDPIFNEIKPPYVEELGLSGCIDKDKVKLWKDHFKSCVKDTAFLDCVYRHPVYDYYKYFNLSPDQSIEMVANYFCELRAFADLYNCEEYNEIADRIEKECKTDPMNAFETLYAYTLAIRPYRSVLRGQGYIHSENRAFFKRSKEKVEKNGISAFKIRLELPYEVGKFLCDKIPILVAKNMHGAIELRDECKGVREMIDRIRKDIEKEKGVDFNEKIEEVSSGFINLWNEADKLKRKIDLAEHGISFGFAVIGSFATIPFAGLYGFLTGLGFEVAEQIPFVKKSYDYIGEKIIRWRAPGYVSHIYDFKKKISIENRWLE
jgi:hypothetical protein